ncbi:hypothetical protein C8J57DRAFT_296185 [Mycena rebaudengoi]|nr:hypothetical protein C8J57DRAFT_296185 [Mycena rebaudengoi]
MANYNGNTVIYQKGPSLATAADFAVVLGFAKPSEHTKEREIPEGREYERLMHTGSLLERNSTGSEEQQDIEWDKFCANYLPATVDRFLNLPVQTDWHPVDPTTKLDLPLKNPWLSLLVSVQHTPYFAKYFRSSHPTATDGKQLPRIIAERLVSLSERLESRMTTPIPNQPGIQEYYGDIAANALQFLSTLLTHFSHRSDIHTIIPPQTIAQLLPSVSKWRVRHRGQFLGDVSFRVQAYLSGMMQRDPELKSFSEEARKTWKNWEVCGLPSCQIKKDLKACGKCQTVRYCSPDHQGRHWKYTPAPHKKHCHGTAY